MTEVPEFMRRAMELRGLDPDEVAAKAAEVADTLHQPEPPPAAPNPRAASSEVDDGQQSLLGVVSPPEREASEPPGGMPDDIALYATSRSGRVNLHRNESFPDGMTLGEARRILAERIEPAGSRETCPACGCLAHVARRSVHSAQAHGLCLIYRAGGDRGYVDTARITNSNSGMDVAKSVWFGLLEEMDGERRPDGGPRGFYRLTALGIAFVLGRERITKYLHVFNNEVQWTSGDLVSIHDCLGDRFDYASVMGYS